MVNYWKIQRKEELREIYYERWIYCEDFWTNAGYDEYGSKYQYVVGHTRCYLCKDDDDYNRTINNEKELEELMKICINYYDGEETPAYTKEKIKEEIEKFKERRRIDIEETLKREQIEKEKIIRNKKRNEPLRVQIKQYIK